MSWRGGDLWFRRRKLRIQAEESVQMKKPDTEDQVTASEDDQPENGLARTPRHSAARPSSFAAIISDAAERRPIRPKSLIMTIFGDSVLPRGGVVWLGSIVSMARLFGMAEPLVRTSALRLTYDGWLKREQVGKRSYYSMAEDFAVANSAYQNHIYGSGAELRMNGWTILKVFTDKSDRKTAYRLRQELDRNGFGQLAPQVFIHPSIGEAAAHHIATLGGSRSAVGPIFFADSNAIDLQTMQHLVATAWDLTPVREAYIEFIEAFDRLPDLLARTSPTMQEAFVLRILMMHYYRRVALRDPRLPESARGENWPGERAYSLMGEVYRKLLPGSEAYLEQTLETLPGQTVSSDVRLHRRFGLA
jgi:phenylacetic acid degradation operon negative regulatory protein